MKNIRIKAAIFDMDGTLVDSLGVWETIWSGLGKRFIGDSSFRPDPDFDKLCRTMTMKESMAEVHRIFNFGESTDEVYNCSVEICVKYYKETVTLKKGVREFLDALYGCGVKMAVATASPMIFVNIALDRLGLRKYFAEVISCDEVGRNKEFPDVFLEAMKRLGAPLSETWVFEDSLTAIKTATRAGFSTVGIYDKNNFGCEEAMRVATEYIGESDTLARLISKITSNN